MKASDLVYETVSALRANRVRSLLTVLGIVIGIAAVIAMTALIGGIKQALMGELGLSQARLVSLDYWGDNHPLRVTDVDSFMTDLADDYEIAVPYASSSDKVASITKSQNGYIFGTLPGYFDIMNLDIVQGECFTLDDCDDGEMVCMLDEWGVKILFGKGDVKAVGQSIRIGSSEYRIVGVVQAFGTNDRLENANITVYMPISTFGQRIMGDNTIEAIHGMARDENDIDGAVARTKEWAIRHLGLSDFDAENNLWIYTSKARLDELNTTMSSFQALMTVVASVSLVVGGIGIMNMMLTNVTERIREIGLRKALGARARDITRQFLLESIFLTLSGGIIGITVGFFGSFAIAGLVANGANMGSLPKITPVLDIQTMFLVAAICVAIGVLFGYYPALQAAKLDPVESLHYQ